MSRDTSLQQGCKIAVIGSGAGALGAAWALSRHHDVTIFEQNAHLGGHANTVVISEADGRGVAVDTGFIVYNERTYPNLIRMFEQLAVPTKATDMSFGVSLDEGAMEYSGESLRGLFGQPLNLVRPRFLGMVADILRFYRNAPRLMAMAEPGPSLGEYLSANRYGDAFVQDHLLPMAAAIWSAPASTMLDFPAISFVRFCSNHGLLQLTDRPQWRTVIGGSREYIRRLTADMRHKARLNTPVLAIERHDAGVDVITGGGQRDRFDEVVIGAHADEALGLLARPSQDERRLLGAFGYQENLAVLHGDTALMPKRRKLWASWNYMGRTGPDGARHLCVSYWMNRLQSLETETPVIVTLNPITPPRPEMVHASFVYHHPMFDGAAMAAQGQLASIQGANRVWFCGSYFGYGFHEDAFSSGLATAEAMGCPAPWLSQPMRRAAE
ncbi:NAD/FAD-binding protein [Paramagnetospirillum marisnigri]|uniref:NAD/FAD-binding protein n=1 Tax=Paramagnetospirillum marisnigri TaxID=1285242 RepID=A0A178MS06_9PROT|nr:FAD-dependent oxidoreductase [Paramagnetospirillum marisnigri]OAN52391.1 NAD/FAD-binding protein [Paramagnetospirillum marisnigri]